MRRRLLQVLLALLVCALPFVAAVAPARADDVSSLLALVNALRATRGAQPLTLDPTLTRIDQAWSNHMAATGVLADDTNLPSEIPTGWSDLGMNSGFGSSITLLFNLFVKSPPHLANMVNPAFNLTGIGVAASANGTLWVTQDFEALAGTSTGTTSPPATTPVTSPPPTTPPTRASHVDTAAPTTTTTTAPTTTTTALPAPTTVPQAPTTVPTSEPWATTSPTLLPGSLSSGPLATAPAALSVDRSSNSEAGWALALAIAGIVIITAAAVCGSRTLRRH